MDRGSAAERYADQAATLYSEFDDAGEVEERSVSVESMAEKRVSTALEGVGGADDDSDVGVGAIVCGEGGRESDIRRDAQPECCSPERGGSSGRPRAG